MTTLEVGRVFAKDFRVVRPLREGGMGAVYIVDQLSTGKQRALKVMVPELAKDPSVRERFILEARAASKIESDHVVEIVTAGVDDETQDLYLVMELLKGEELADALARTGPLPIADVAEVLSQMGHALEQAHAAGLVHRDLKPENVFLAVSKRKDAAFTVKILDFGIAKLVQGGAEKTGTQPLGSPLYMAPEQTDRQGRICPQTDVWALGLIVFTLLTNTSYWPGVDEAPLAAILRAICIDPLPPASERAAAAGVELPPGFDAWFGRCVNRDIDARFADAGEAVRAFLAIVPPGATARKLSAEASPLAATGSVGAETGGAGASRARLAVTPSGQSAVNALAATAASDSQFVGSRTGPAPAGERPRQRGALLIVGALAVAALGSGAYFAFRKQGGPAGVASAAPSVDAADASARPSSAASSLAAAPPANERCPAGMIFHGDGKMVMGAKDGGRDDTRPTHRVTLGAYCLDRTEVTVDAYLQCVDLGVCEKPPAAVNIPDISPAAKAAYTELCTARQRGFGDHPINCVDWDMARKYCESVKKRLPTEAEWEYAARGTAQRDYPWGDEKPDETRLNACGAECVRWGKERAIELQPMFSGDDGFAGTAPVGHYPAGATPAGEVDLAGNVAEWTADFYGPYSAADVTNPKGPDTGAERVIRGGAFNSSEADWAKPAYRWRSPPGAYNHAIGFRCAADPLR